MKGELMEGGVGMCEGWIGRRRGQEESEEKTG